LVEREQFSEDVFAHFDYIFRLDKRTVFQAADNKQENVATNRIHLHSVDIDPTYFEETSNIFKNVDKKKSELVERFFHTSFVIN
jgi:hypothetical protein